ncbi:MAG TPA: acyl-CoA dehydrogenase [Rhodocyclaceae bacterium]|nr:acyl-CoA dehydrogenase [Rhodocyclaceae bacterium]
MSAYLAPLRDMQFILRDIAGLDEVVALPGYEEASPDLAEAILEEAGKFAAGVLAPLNRTGDIQGCRLEDGSVQVPDGWQEAYRRYMEAGWIGLSLPPDYGGQGLPKLLSAPVWEMWHAANLAFAMLPQLNVGQAEALLIAASDEQKERWLHKVVSGEWASTMNLTEPQAGSDLAATRCRAEAQADGSYRLFGQKIFISYGEHEVTENIVHLVLARLPDAPEGVKGLSLFLVPKYLVEADGSLGARNDVRCISLEHKLGIHGSPTCTMVYGDAGGAVAEMIGQPNRGLEIMFAMMNDARFGVGIQGVALAERASQMAVAYARERIQGRNAKTGQTDLPIIHHPDVKRMLLGMRARIMAMRGLLYTVAGWSDLAHRHTDPALASKYQRYVDLLMPVAKGWCSEVGNEVCDEAIQVFGGMGFVEETGVAQYFRDARVITLYEGTTGIQANDLVGRKILREDGATLKELIADIRQTAGKFSNLEAHEAMGHSLAEDVRLLERASETILARGKAGVMDEVLAVAVPFLHCLGTVCGSWQMARATLAADARLAAGEGDADYLRGILDLAHFYFTHVAPHAAAHARTVINDDDAVSRFDSALF